MDEGPGLTGALFAVLGICMAVGAITLLHEPGACYVSKAAWMLGNPC